MATAGCVHGSGPPPHGPDLPRLRARGIWHGFANLTDGIGAFLDALGNIPGFGWAKEAADKMRDAADKARGLAQGLKDINDQPVNVRFSADYTPAFATAMTALNSGRKYNGMDAAIGQATGGLVIGPGTSTSDSVPRWLSNGEYVLQASAVDRIGVGALDALNSGGVLAGNPLTGGTLDRATDVGALSRILDVRIVGDTDGGKVAPIFLQLDSRNVWHGLLRLKRAGGMELGLA